MLPPPKDPATVQASENCGDVSDERRVNEINFIPTAPLGRKDEEDSSMPEDESADL